MAQPAIPASFRPLDSLVPYARNARTHSAAQVAEIAASILEWGWTVPVLADSTGIVAGHGRVLAARQIYDSGRIIRLPSGEQVPDGMVPVVDVTGWTDGQRRAYILADNRIPLNAGWDAEMLAVELDDLRDLGVDLDKIGFTDEELNDMIGTPKVPESKAKEIDPDNYTMGHKCPRCGFEFNNET